MHRFTLVTGTGVLGIAVGIASAFVTDADAAPVESVCMPPCLAQREVLPYMSVCRYVEMKNGVFLFVPGTAMNDKISDHPVRLAVCSPRPHPIQELKPMAPAMEVATAIIILRMVPHRFFFDVDIVFFILK